ILTEEARGGLEAAIDADEGLTARQKKVLRELCAHFRSENVRAEVAAEEAAEKAAALADALGDTPVDAPVDLLLDGEPTATTTSEAARDAR
ncbi:MAG: hypothetical protein ACJ756_01485, partial [Solirubrobacterales bacterium]